MPNLRPSTSGNPDHRLNIAAYQILPLEGHFIKIPSEQLRYCNRLTLKHTVKHLGTIKRSLEKLPSSREAACKELDNLTVRLGRLKRKLKSLFDDEARLIGVVGDRMDHLEALCSIKSSCGADYAMWCRTRLNRLLVDQCCRQGHIEIAAQLAKRLDVANFSDHEFYASIIRIEESLRNGSTKECLNWCIDNRFCLKKQKSLLEFRLRMQDYITLARARKIDGCIEYARTYLAEFMEDRETRCLMLPILALVAFPPETQLRQYRQLYSNSTWDDLAILFNKEVKRLYSLNTFQSPLNAAVQAGLSAIKTARCEEPEFRVLACPVCGNPVAHEFAKNLPRSHFFNSSYICRITGRIMTDCDYPLVTPDGQIYSSTGVEHAMALQQKSLFVCPCTGKAYPATKLRRLYLT